MSSQLSELLAQVTRDAFEWAPRLIVMFLLIVLGLVVAWAVERVLRAALARLKFDKLLARSGIDRALARMGVRTPIDDVVPRIVFYLVLFLFARAAADVLGLVAISEAIAAAMDYVPNVAAAILILMIGAAVAQFAGRAVTGMARESGAQFGSALGTVTSGFIFFVLATMAVAQLRIDTRMVQLAAGAVLGGVALGFGLALGLGSREVMKSVLAGFYARQLLTVGQEIEVGGERGVLVSITPTQLLLETETELVAVPNVVLMESGGRQKKESHAGSG